MVGYQRKGAHYRKGNRAPRKVEPKTSPSLFERLFIAGCERIYHFCYSLGLFTARAGVTILKWLARIFSPVKGIYQGIAIFILTIVFTLIVKPIGWFISYMKRAALGIGSVFIHARRAHKRRNLLFGFRVFFGGVVVKTIRHKAFSAITSLAFISVVVFASFHLANMTFAYDVDYAGRSLGYVSDQAVFEAASTEAMNQVYASDKESVDLDRPAFKLVMVNKRELQSADRLSSQILKNYSDVIVEGTGLFIDEELVTATDDEEALRSLMQGILDDHKTGAANERVSFVQQIHIRHGFYSKSDYVSIDNIQEKLESQSGRLDVKAVRRETSVQPKPYKVIKDVNTSYSEGYEKMTTMGVPGEEQVTQEVTYVDGKETDRQLVESVTLKDPVDEVIVLGGSGQSSVALCEDIDETKGVALGGKLLWPVQRVANMQVTSRWGDGRGHDAWDIAAYTGTEFYAADGGVVVAINCFDWSYGKAVLVDHGNGMQTFYAHCNSIDVHVGQRVERGDKLGEIGETGRTTGSHLHFEVQIDGEPVDPGPYIS